MNYKQVFTYLGYKEGRRGDFFIELSNNDTLYVIYLTKDLQCFSFTSFSDISPIQVLLENLPEVNERFITELELENLDEYSLDKVASQNQIIQFITDIRPLDFGLYKDDDIHPVCNDYDKSFYKYGDNHYSLVLTDKRNKILNLIAFNKDEYFNVFNNKTAYWSNTSILDTNTSIIAFNPYSLLNYVKDNRNYHTYIFLKDAPINVFAQAFMKLKEDSHYIALYNRVDELIDILRIISLLINLQDREKCLLSIHNYEVVLTLIQNDYDVLLQYSQKIAILQKKLRNIISTDEQNVFSDSINYKSISVKVNDTALFNVTISKNKEALELICQELISMFNIKFSLVYV